MKKLRAFACFLLALTFLTPLATLTACKTTQSALPPTAPIEPIEPIEPVQPIEPIEPVSPAPTPETDNATPNTPTTTPEPTPEPEPEPTPIVQYAKYIQCTGDNVNLRSGASTSYAVLGQAEEGTSYAVLEKSGNWYKTFYRGKTAYLYASYAALFTIEESKNDKIESVVNEGYKLIGVPYVYGAVRFHDGTGKLLSGFSAEKFDCSSLVQYIFYKGAGKILQVTTRTQVKQGTFVAKKNIQRGDLLFFTNETRQHLTGVERVGHVALYLGDNYILHTASDYARIEKISASRWKFYVEARRFI